MAIRSKMRTNSKSKRGTLKSKRKSIKRQRGGDSKHGTECFERKKIIFEGTEPLICKKSLKHLTKKGKKRKSTLPKNKQEKCYNTTCWHRLSMKDRIMYKSKIKKAKAEVKKAPWAKEAQIANKRRKELAEAEKKTKEKAELNKAIKDTVSRYGAIQSSQKYFNNIREQAYAQLPPISMATQNNSTPTNLAEQAEGGLNLNNTRGNMFATTSFMGENMKPGVNVVSNDNTVLQNTSSNNPARNMSTPKSRKTRQNRQLKISSHKRRFNARRKAQGELKRRSRENERSKSKRKKNRNRAFRNNISYNTGTVVLRKPEVAEQAQAQAQPHAQIDTETIEAQAIKIRELEAELAELIQENEKRVEQLLETQRRAQEYLNRAANQERRAANLNLSQ